ncbi:hypothetical protein [Donghicola mangrovi]|uniref:Sulfotransferase domain-containing protein n=1 Tax=Donghicola mangrovi TaxID=2729614 RepID=A0A850Q535_9RHOB|nr:hypothetical protein [Donghicola mangrovi]NVO24827.1 sulfotransferase domain-containing protein [Donghicola mangrovi]
MRHADFFLMGPPSRSATHLWRWLSQHRDVFMPARRELGYYALPDLHTDLDMESDPRLSDVTELPEPYFKCFKPAGDRLIGDGSSLYSLVPGAGRRIFKDNPNAKFVFVLENPVTRAVSAHRYNVDLGLEQEPHFDAALQKEPERLANGESPFFGYATGSRYRQMIEPLDILFGPENVLIIIAEEAVQQPLAALNRIRDFLDIGAVEEILPFRARSRQSAVAEVLSRVRSRRRQPEVCSMFQGEMVSEILWMEARTGSPMDLWHAKVQD